MDILCCDSGKVISIIIEFAFADSKHCGGRVDTQLYSLKTFWNYAAFQNPTAGAVGSW